MAIVAITGTIAGTTINIKDGSFRFTDIIEQRSQCTFIVQDATGLHFSYGQVVQITDSVAGNLFFGFVDTSDESRLPGSSGMIQHSIKCMDPVMWADKRTITKNYFGLYAGVVVADMVKQILAAEGVTAAYAIENDTLQADFASGTLTNTTATSANDLELALAGTQVTITENTTANFASGTLTNCTASSNTLTPTATKALRVQSTQSVPGVGNAYTYLKIWAGSQLIGASNFIDYDIWIDPGCPEAKIAVDMVFSDGTTWRDTAVYTDVQNIAPHPQNDLTGLATGQWYHRDFFLGNYSGKTISYFSIGIEGDKTGVYTAWIKNLFYTDVSRVPITNFFNGTLQVSPAQQLQNNGYSSTMVTVVNTYDLTNQNAKTSNSYRVSTAYSIDAAKILRSSFLNYQVSLPTNTTFTLKYSIDTGASYIACTNNAPLPDLPAGLGIAGASLMFREEFGSVVGGTPEVTPILSAVTLQVMPSYNATKTDILYSIVTGAGWTTGNTLTNTANLTGNNLSLNGTVRNFDDGSTANMTLFGNGSPAQVCTNRTFTLQCAATNEVRSRFDFAGNFADFTCEFDVQVTTGVKVGLCYRTPSANWGNPDGSPAYVIELQPTSLALFHCGNSSSGGTFTAVTGSPVALTLTSGNWYRMKVVVVGSSHKIYLNEVLLINTTDSTFTAAGMVGFRNRNTLGSVFVAALDNFGIMATTTGTWVSSAQSLTSAGTYGTSVISWQDQSSGQSTLLVEASINGGSTWQTCTNGSPIPNFTANQSLSGVNLTMRVTLTTTAASSLPAINNFTVRILGAFSATGTRVSPALSLANVGRLGASGVNWTATTPASTSVAVATSTDNITYTSVANGGAINGLTPQPAPTLDNFAVNSSANYTQTFQPTTGSASTDTWDTANSRISLVGGSRAMLLYTSITAGDLDMTAIMSQTDVGGLCWRVNGTHDSYYQLIVNDASSFNTPNDIALFKCVSGTRSYVNDKMVTFPRGTYHAVRVTMLAGVITVFFDGIQIFTSTDGSPLAAGSCGLANDGGTTYVSDLRIQPLGQDVSALSAYTKVTLTSTDPTATPAMQELAMAATGPSIGLGTLVPSVAYTPKTFVSGNINDLAKKSDYLWNITKAKALLFQQRKTTPAPWPLSSKDILVVGLKVSNGVGTLYRNRQNVIGVVDTIIFSDTKIGDGSATSWALAYPLASAPTILLNGQSQTIGIKGVDTGKQFYWASGDNTIYQDASGIVLQQTDTLSIPNATGTYETTVVRNNTGGFAGTTSQSQFQAINLGTGIVEATEDVTGQGVNKAAAQALGDTLLQKYGVLGRTINFRTLRDGLATGMYQNAFIPEHSITNAQVLIQQVDIVPFTSLDPLGSGNPTIRYWYTVIAVEGPAAGSWAKTMVNALNGN